MLISWLKNIKNEKRSQLGLFVLFYFSSETQDITGALFLKFRKKFFPVSNFINKF